MHKKKKLNKSKFAGAMIYMMLKDKLIRSEKGHVQWIKKSRSPI